VLDPFLGSGSTGRAAVLEGFDFIGIEKDVEHGYVAIAEARIADAVREREEDLAAAIAADSQIDMFAADHQQVSA
jgi:DNA modification methylase